MRFITVIILSSLFLQVFAGHSDTLKKVTKRSDLVIEKYYVNKYGTKEGKYKYYFRSELLISGNYHNGKKQGLWKYRMGDFYVDAYYTDGEKDSTWKYYYVGQLIAKYSPNKQKYQKCTNEGNLIVDADSVDGKWIEQYFYNSGILKKRVVHSGQYTTVTSLGEDGDTLQSVECFLGLPYHMRINKLTLKNYGSFTEYDAVIYTGNVINGNGCGIVRHYNTKTNTIIAEYQYCFKDSLLDGKYQASGIYQDYYTGQFDRGFLSGIWYKSDTSFTYLTHDSVATYDTVNIIGHMYYNHKENVCVEETSIHNWRLYKLIEYIYDELKITDFPLKYKDGSRIKVEITVGEEGEILSLDIFDGSGKIIPVEKVASMNQYPPVFPLFMNGKPVKVIYTIPFILK